MPASVTVNTKGNKVFRHIMTELASAIKMMDLQHFNGTAVLASPSISVQDLYFELFVLLQFQSQSGLFLAYSLHFGWLVLRRCEVEVPCHTD